MSNKLSILWGALLRAAPTIPLAGTASGHWAGTAVINSGYSYTAVAATDIKSDSIILVSAIEAANGALTEPIVVTSKVAGVGFCFLVNSLSVGKTAGPVRVSWVLVQPY